MDAPEEQLAPKVDENTQTRALLCGLALIPFCTSPDETYVAACKTLLDERLVQGDEAYAVKSMRDAFEHMRKTMEPEAVFERLAVERTRLFRATSPSGPMPPYEGAWLTGQSASTALVKLNRVYARAGLVEAAGERSDYLGILLGFYQHLIMHRDPSRRAFFDEHLAHWTGRYVEYALTQTESAFFKGHLALVRAFLRTEEELTSRLDGTYTRTQR